MFWFSFRQPTEFELKIACWFFGTILVSTLITYVILSETDVKKCRKICEEKGYNHSIYIPSDEGITDPECKCCNLVETEDGAILEDCIEVDLY